MRWCTNWMKESPYTASTCNEAAEQPPSVGRFATWHHGGILNPYIQSILLGIVEGLTEFLPVSSTAHLRIAEALMKIPLDDAYWKMYTIVIQTGRDSCAGSALSGAHRRFHSHFSQG